MARILGEILRREIPTEEQGKFEKMDLTTCRFYCPFREMGEKPSPLGEDFSI